MELKTVASYTTVSRRKAIGACVKMWNNSNIYIYISTDMIILKITAKVLKCCAGELVWKMKSHGRDLLNKKGRHQGGGVRTNSTLKLSPDWAMATYLPEFKVAMKFLDRTAFESKKNLYGAIYTS